MDGVIHEDHKVFMPALSKNRVQVKKNMKFKVAK